jgi:hypothetical protein
VAIAVPFPDPGVTTIWMGRDRAEREIRWVGSVCLAIFMEGDPATTVPDPHGNECRGLAKLRRGETIPGEARVRRFADVSGRRHLDAAPGRPH